MEMYGQNLINQSEDTVIENRSCSQPRPDDSEDKVYWTISDETDDLSSRDEGTSRGPEVCGNTDNTMTIKCNLQTSSCWSICPSKMIQIKSKSAITSLCRVNVLTDDNSADTSCCTLGFSEQNVDQQSNKRNTKCSEKNRMDDRNAKRTNSDISNNSCSGLSNANCKTHLQTDVIAVDNSCDTRDLPNQYRRQLSASNDSQTVYSVQSSVEQQRDNRNTNPNGSDTSINACISLQSNGSKNPQTDVENSCDRCSFPGQIEGQRSDPDDSRLVYSLQTNNGRDQKTSDSEASAVAVECERQQNASEDFHLVYSLQRNMEPRSHERNTEAHGSSLIEILAVDFQMWTFLQLHKYI